MNIPRHYYNPTETQKMQLALRVRMMRMRLAAHRAEREYHAIINRVVPVMKRHGWDDKAALELATLHAENQLK